MTPEFPQPGQVSLVGLEGRFDIKGGPRCPEPIRSFRKEGYDFPPSEALRKANIGPKWKWEASAV